MKRLLTMFLVASLCLAGSSVAFDGNRKGFVLGGGLGICADASYSADGVFGFEDNAAGFGLNLVIGGAFNERNMLVYEGNVAGWKSDLVNDNISQGFNGAAWYHYFGQTGRTGFITVGLGAYVFQAEDYDDNDMGFGMLLGGGYEFSRHWQVGGYLSFGQTSDAYFDYNHHHMCVLVSGIAF